MDEAAAFDWGVITGKSVERLRKPKIPPCPPSIVAQAQAAYDDKDVKGYEFPTEQLAAEFARLLRNNAGFHTKPQTTVQPVIDPEDEGNMRLVHWKASLRRGRAGTTAA